MGQLLLDGEVVEVTVLDIPANGVIDTWGEITIIVGELFCSGGCGH